MQIGDYSHFTSNIKITHISEIFMHANYLQVPSNNLSDSVMHIFTNDTSHPWLISHASTSVKGILTGRITYLYKSKTEFQQNDMKHT